MLDKHARATKALSSQLTLDELLLLSSVMLTFQ